MKVGYTRLSEKTALPKLAAPALRALVAADIHCLEDLSSITERELASLHGMGPNAISKLKFAMEERGIRLAPAQN